MKHIRRLTALLLCLLLLAAVPLRAVAEDPMGGESETANTSLTDDPNFSLLGKNVTIPSGKWIYENANDSNGQLTEEAMVVAITGVTTIGGSEAMFYKFSLNGEDRWVLATDTTPATEGNQNENSSDNETTTPEESSDSTVCTCGENAPANLADHTDSCPRKQHIRSLIVNENGGYKTASQIYADWGSYDSETRTDILNMVQRYAATTYSSLLQLLQSESADVTVGQTSIHVSGLPAGITLSAQAVAESNYHSDLNTYLIGNSELLYAYDLSLTTSGGDEWQPAEGQSVTVTLDFGGMGLPDGNTIQILHDHSGTLEALGSATITDGKLTFTTNSFSSFYFYITYIFDGYQYTMTGGSTIMLSELLRELNISYTVSQVTGVAFSNSDVLEITKIGQDWELKSLMPFGEIETLTITFSDGQSIEVAAKDPTVLNYALSEQVTNLTKLTLTESHNFGTASGNGDHEADNKTFTVNAVSITYNEVWNYGSAVDDQTTDLILYVREGMAVRFGSNTDWPADKSRPKFSDNNIWYWSWNGADNYVIVKGGNVGKHEMFTISATQNSVIHYCNVMLCVVDDAKDYKLLHESNVLPTGYSIKEVPVTLYNYDAEKFNGNYSGNSFQFRGVSMGKETRATCWGVTNNGVNGGGTVAQMGIVKNQLVNGLPVMSQGTNVDLFSTNAVAGKTVYSNVDFEFVYEDNTGYYTYDSSLNHAQYNSSDNKIELYNASLSPADNAIQASHGNAGFYPFVDIEKSFTNTGYAEISQNEWLTALATGFQQRTAKYAADIVSTDSENPGSTVDLHFGLQISSPFYLPKDKKLNGQEMKFEFTGDDDLWVFIDGQLVLDIGGGHTDVSGSFNLTTGEIWVSKYSQLTATQGGSYAAGVVEQKDYREDSIFLKNLAGDQMHTIQIFYLERFAGVSNCRMRFNLPLAPAGSVYVSKELTNQDGEKLSITPNDVEYTFTVYKADGTNDIVDNNLTYSPLTNYSYKIQGDENTMYTTKSNGSFTLKAGQTAIFENIPRFAKVYVVESAPNDGYIYAGATVSVNNTTAKVYTCGQKTETVNMTLNASITFDFVNKMQTQPLTVEKQVVNGTDGLIKKNQKFDLTLNFNEGKIVETGENAIQANDNKTLTNGKAFQLGHGESITIPRVPVNMAFTLEETNPDSTNNSFDTPVVETEHCTLEKSNSTAFCKYNGSIGKDGANKITVHNQQRFDLTITKAGISAVDHDQGDNPEETQSTIYTVTGKAGTKTIANLDVTICGNGSVIIKKLPVGSYTVKEDTNWSWRYEPKDGATKNVTIPSNAQAKVEYTNQRKQIYWLSGDCYCENFWGKKATSTKSTKRS